MNNSTLVNNTDRVYGEQDALKRPPARHEYKDTESECLIWMKILVLLFFTFGLIVAMYVLS